MLKRVTMVVNSNIIIPNPRYSLTDILDCFTHVCDDNITRLGVAECVCNI